MQNHEPSSKHKVALICSNIVIDFGVVLGKVDWTAFAYLVSIEDRQPCHSIKHGQMQVRYWPFETFVDHHVGT